jgi:AcrR family transcriptional regulator
VLLAAVALVDREGLDALTMRKLGSALGVEAMSLYKHVRNKEAILDGIVDLVAAEIEAPDDDEAPWLAALRDRAVSSRRVLTRHPWAIGLLESRRVLGPSLLRSLDAALGNLRSAGFTIEDAAHTLWLLDSFVYGHVVHETSRQSDDAEAQSAEAVLEQVRSSGYPHLAELGQHALASDFTVDKEFDIGLELILEALARRHDGARETLSGRPS